MAHLKWITEFNDLLPQQKITLHYFSSTDSAHKSSLSFKDTKLRLQSWELALLQIWREEPEDRKAEISQAVRTKNIEPNTVSMCIYSFNPFLLKWVLKKKHEIITCYPRICRDLTPLWSFKLHCDSYLSSVIYVWNDSEDKKQSHELIRVVTHMTGRGRQFLFI